MKETDRKRRALTEIGASAGERQSDAAAPMRSNLLRFEHELQNRGGRRLGAAAITLKCSRHRRRRLAMDKVPHGAARSFRLPCFRSIGRRASRRADLMTRVRRLPIIGNHHSGPAGCPDGTQPELLTVSLFFIRLQARNWQAACAFRPPRRHFAAVLAPSLIYVFKFRLTTSA